MRLDYIIISIKRVCSFGILIPTPLSRIVVELIYYLFLTAVIN
nr:MAG TPA: hypothetical protein [Caudoviricetes sp.]